jgi:hypothetical protein
MNNKTILSPDEYRAMKKSDENSSSVTLDKSFEDGWIAAREFYNIKIPSSDSIRNFEPVINPDEAVELESCWG